MNREPQTIIRFMKSRESDARGISLYKLIRANPIRTSLAAVAFIGSLSYASVQINDQLHQNSIHLQAANMLANEFVPALGKSSRFYHCDDARGDQHENVSKAYKDLNGVTEQLVTRYLNIKFQLSQAITPSGSTPDPFAFGLKFPYFYENARRVVFDAYYSGEASGTLKEIIGLKQSGKSNPSVDCRFHPFPANI